MDKILSVQSYSNREMASLPVLLEVDLTVMLQHMTVMM